MTTNHFKSQITFYEKTSPHDLNAMNLLLMKSAKNAVCRNYMALLFTSNTYHIAVNHLYQNDFIPDSEVLNHKPLLTSITLEVTL